MQTSGMDISYFYRSTANSNKFARGKVVAGKFGGTQWKNIKVEEMVHFYGIML